MLEAFGAMLRSTKLQAAWVGTIGSDEAGTEPDETAAADPMSPVELLHEIERLMRQGFEARTIESYVGRQELTSALGPEDLEEWKEADVPESVIRIALDLPVR
jgi:hypothetical protein